MLKSNEAGSNEPKVSKRKLPNSNGSFNQGGRNPRGDQDFPAKFRKQIGSRPPFNKGNNNGFNWQNRRGGTSDRQSNRAPSNFNPMVNKPWYPKNANLQPRSDEQSSSDEKEMTLFQHKKFKDNKMESKQIKTAPIAISDEESSSEIEMQSITRHSGTAEANDNHDDTETSSSEEELNNSKEKNEEHSRKFANSNKNKGAITKGKYKKNMSNLSVSDRTVLVKKLPQDTKVKHMVKFFGRYGKIQTCKMNTTHPCKCSSITFEKQEDALKAVKEVNGLKYKEHRLIVLMSNNNDKFDSSKTILVSKLDLDVNMDDLWTAFESCGPVHKILLPRKKKNCREYAFVEFEHADSKELAIRMKNITIKNEVKEIRDFINRIKTVAVPDQKVTAHKSEIKKCGIQSLGKSHSTPKVVSGSPRKIPVQRNDHDGSFSITVANNAFQAPLII